jgi:hypothetical protein
MATVITGITNNTNTDFRMLVPGYNTSRPNILINALTTYNLFDYLTPDEIWAMQTQLEPLVRDGTFSVTATSIFPFTPVTSLRADNNNQLVGDLQLISGTNVSLTQLGAAIAINVPGGGLAPSNFVIGDDLTSQVGSNTFILTDVPISGTVSMYVNGVRQREGIGNDYTISGKLVTFNYTPQSEDSILADYLM